VIAYLVPMLAVVLWPTRGAVAPATPGTELDAAELLTPTAVAATSRRRGGWVAGSVAICAALAATGLALANHRGTPPPRAPRVAPTQKILYATLNDVACSPAAQCVAVGEFLGADKDATTGDPDGHGGASRTLVESSNGDHWHVTSSPDEGKGGAVLSGVSCPATGRCVAVGYYRPDKFPLDATSAPPNYPLIETYNGGLWHLVASPRVPPNSILTSVSCPSVTVCLAVGYTTSDGSAEESLFAESLDGDVWSVMPTSSSPGTSSGLSSVACSSSTRCVAVGNVAPHDDPSATMPLIEGFDGERWSPAALPTAADGRGILYDVACTPGGHCVAVGSTEAHRSSGAALVLSSSGTIWSPDAAAMDQSGDISLTTVACANAAGCVVAGTSLASLGASPEKILARVSATTWEKLDVLSASATIDAVTCGAAWGCLLVGNAARNSFGNTTAVIASLSGDTWTIESTPAP
jgi:hypothetical protein